MPQKITNKIFVIKIGTSVLTNDKGELDAGIIKDVTEQVAQIKKHGFGVVMVTSGAIVAGMQLLGLDKRPENLPEIQACAAIGQAQLMKIYDEYFKKSGLMTAQILLTQDDVNNRTRYLNARNTLSALLKKDVIPIVNENDTVSTEEIKFGDNDRLSSLVANLVEADKLIIMSNVDGLYKYDNKDKTRKDIIGRVGEITEEIESLIEDEYSRFGIGGMTTKLQAAKIATNAGIECILINGKRKGALIDILNKKAIGTVFVATQPKISARKRWIAYSSKAAGVVSVDSGAKEVLIKKNRSLLASGITGLSGKFEVGDTVNIVDESNKEFARGITNYSSAELSKIKGRKTKDIEGILGYKYYDEVVHRDNLVIL